MNSKYTGKLVEHLLDKISSLSSGDVGDFIGTGLLDKFLRKDLDERTPHSLASDKKLEVGNFVSGTAGAVIYIDELTKHSVAEIDKLYVRLKAYFEQLEIINVNSVGGKLIISPAGGIKCSLVETYDSWGYYRCYFLSEQDGEKIENRFVVGDLAYSKTFNAREGSYNKISNRYYCRLVVGVGENYIDLSKLDCDADSDEPQEGDVIVHRGNRNDVDRLNCLEFSSVDSFSPSITLYQGINDYSLADKNVIQFGVEKSTGKAFMNVYGDMFIGNRDNSSYIRYSPEKGVEIKGKLDIGTSFGDKTLLDAIDLASTAYEEDLNNLKDIVNRDILNILNLLDGAIETWFYDPAPTLTNLPASLWTTESDRNIHLGDLYYSGAGRAYRFQYDADNSLYYWQEIVDTDIVLALENAKKAQDTADSKRKIFVRKPEASDSYDIGDMWVNATYSDGNVTYTEDLLRAILSKEIGEQFSITHWTLASKYTDDTVANDALQKATEAQNSVNELLNSVGDFKDYVDNAFLDGIIDTSEAQAIEKYINLLNTIKLQVDKSYEEIIKNSILENTLYLTNLNNSYIAFSSSYTELINTINSAISDSKTTDLEKAAVDGKYKTFNDKYRDYTAYLNLAINYIEETINGKVERALLDIGGYKYLKAALLENTSIEGGLIQSSMLSLGYTKNNLFLVMAGTNGLVLDKGDRTIASWFGGGMIDMFDYYDSNTKTFNVPEDVRAAAGLDRMDGTGYRAKGNLWWDEAGVVHADPLSFFVGESTVGGLLASFLIVMKEDGKHPLYLIPQVPFLSLEIADYIRIGDALLKYDSTNKAIYITSADGTTSMGFYASGYVSALGKNSSGSSTGSASALYQLADVAPNSANDGVLNATNGSVLMYNGSKWQAGNVVTDISPLTLNVNGSSLFTYDGKSSITANLAVPTKVSQLTNDTGFITGISSSMVTNALGYTPYNSANPNGYISGITKAMVEGVLIGNITSHTHDYLPLSGGTVTGDLSIIGKTTFLSEGKLKIWNVLSTRNSVYGHEMVFVQTSIDWADPETSWPDKYRNDLFLQPKGGHVHIGPIEIAQNYTCYIAGTLLVTSDLTVNGTIIGSLSGNAATATALTTSAGSDTLPIYFNSGKPVACTASSVFSNLSNSGNSLSVTVAGQNRTLTVNYASNAGNADTLDGYHKDDILRKIFNPTPVTSLNDVVAYGLSFTSWSYSGSANVNNQPWGNGAASAASVVTFGTGYPFQIYSDYNDTSLLYYRSYYSANGWKAWRQFAFLDSNVASATNADKLDGWHLSDITERWTSVITIGQWSRLLKAENHLLGGSFILSIHYTRNSIVVNNVFLITFGHYFNSQIITLGTHSFTQVQLRVTSTGNANDIYVELLDSGYDHDNIITQAVQCQIFNVYVTSITKYTSYTAGGGTVLRSTSTNAGRIKVNDDTVAFTTDNVASATKLQTARTIWGQSFNGTADVNGKLCIGKIWSQNSLNRAELSVISTTDVPCDIFLGANNLYKWSITCRDSSENYMLAFYQNVTYKYACTIDINGNFAATGAVTAKASSSDIRLKTDISDYKALSIIRGHKSIKYHWNAVAKANADIFNDDYWHYGLIAQDVQRDMPQMVSDVFKDYLVINYERLIPICWKGLQEVDDEVTKLKKKVRKLEMEIRELKQKEDRL